MRNKIDEDKKNVKVGITIHPDLSKILDEFSNKNKKTKSRVIQDIMNEHFKNKKLI